MCLCTCGREGGGREEKEEEGGRDVCVQIDKHHCLKAFFSFHYSSRTTLSLFGLEGAELTLLMRL